VRVSMYSALRSVTGLYTAIRVDAGSVASDISIGYRPCHFLNI